MINCGVNDLRGWESVWALLHL